MTDTLPAYAVLERLHSIAHLIAEVEQGSFASFTGSTPLTEEEIATALQSAIHLLKGYEKVTG